MTKEEKETMEIIRDLSYRFDIPEANRVQLERSIRSAISSAREEGRKEGIAELNRSLGIMCINNFRMIAENGPEGNIISAAGISKEEFLELCQSEDIHISDSMKKNLPFEL